MDLFAGTGNISYEMASRGCKNITAVDIHHGCVRYIEETAKKFNLTQIKVYKSNVFSFINLCTDDFDIIFAGPPYKLENIDSIPPKIFEKGLLKKQGWLIVEHSNKLSLDNIPNFDHKRSYGSIFFSIFVL